MVKVFLPFSGNPTAFCLPALTCGNGRWWAGQVARAHPSRTSNCDAIWSRARPAPAASPAAPMSPRPSRLAHTPAEPVGWCNMHVQIPLGSYSLFCPTILYTALIAATLLLQLITGRNIEVHVEDKGKKRPVCYFSLVVCLYSHGLFCLPK